MNTLHNYHTHTHYSDGSSAPVEYIEEAVRQGFSALGFSEHSVLPFENTFALKPGSEAAYTSEIRKLRETFSDRIEVLLALEADYIPTLSTGFEKLKQSLGLDYIIGSVHLVGNSYPDNLWFIDGPKRETYDEGLKQFYNGDIRKAVTAYWHQINSMLENESFAIIGHLDKIKMHNQGRWFREDEKWYASLVNETLALIAEKEVIVEVNTRGIYKGRSDSLFPGETILRIIHERNIPVTISSDAHQPSEISLLFGQAEEMLKKCGIRSVSRYNHGIWSEVGIV
ncbi:histidinol phosphate phosphatase, HisJ family [Lentimicrobium saccharophilum]|uniref:Histidinol-phosphatase n=1 Tax=Lentimicrobium saccharophilum TaxID=1678841 RepID=A0A0S7BWL9_9BACT|nr:histidinol-phosphatase [Lentimicrobium saccharophilum]GAP41921.1 histidinol phosphate phosphatase, HisJ family [Lentimicrobium saccharophilum]